MRRATLQRVLPLRACSTLLWTSAMVVVAAGCPGMAEDVDLGTLRLALWQPQALGTGTDGDLLDDAQRVEVTLVVDGKAEELTLDDGLSAADREAAASGSEVAATLRTTGDTLPDAIARSGLVRLAPGGGDVTVTALLAPPDVAHALSSTVPNQRTGMAVCASDDGRVFAIGGLLGGSLAAGSFVLDREAREVREGPSLTALRSFAACVADDEGGVYLAGGCTEGGAAVTSLEHSETGERGDGFTTERALTGAGCHTRLTRTGAGSLVALTSSHLHRIPAEGGQSTSIALPTPRFGAVLLAFPGDGERVLVGGGFSDVGLTTPVAGSVIYDLSSSGGAPVTVGERFKAAALEGDTVVVVGPTHLSRLSPDGTLETLHALSLPFGFDALQVAPLYDGRYALLDPESTSLRIIGDGAPRSITLPARREHLLSDPGGALLLFGGGTPGVSVVVVE